MANKPLPVATGILKITFFTFKHFSFCKFIRLLLLNSYLYFLVSFYNLGGNRVDILVLKLLLHFFTKWQRQMEKYEQDLSETVL